MGERVDELMGERVDEKRRERKRPRNKLCAILTMLLVLLMAAGAQGAFYADGAQTGTGHDGNEVDPYSKVDMLTAAKVPAGNTVYCRGAFGDITFTSSTTKGSAGGGYVTFSPWPGQTPPTATKVYFTDNYDAYIRFDGVTANGWTITHTEDTLPGIAATGSSAVKYVQFINWRITHEYYSAAFEAGYYKPYYDVVEGDFANSWSVSVKSACEYWLFDHCTFEHGWRLLNLEGLHHIVRNCTFGRAGEDQINSDSCSDILIEDNVFSDTWAYYSAFAWLGDTNDVWTSYVGHQVTQVDTGCTGLYVGQYGGYFYLVADDPNHLPSTGSATYQKDWFATGHAEITFEVTNDGANQHCDCISMNDNTVTDVTIRRNYFHTSGGQCIKIDLSGGYPDDVTIENNVIYWNRSSSAALLLTGGTNVAVTNNTVIHALATGAIYTAGASSTFTLRNNIFTGCSSAAGTVDSDYNAWDGAFPYGAEAHGLQNQTLTTGWFVDFTNAGEVAGDFDLIAGSPAIGIGEDANTPADDYTGGTRYSPDDIGAYDYYVGGVKYFIGLK